MGLGLSQNTEVLGDQNCFTLTYYMVCTVCCKQWCIAKNGGGYTQRGVAKGQKVPCLFMITEVSIRCQNTRRLVYGVYPRIPPKTPLAVSIIKW